MFGDYIKNLVYVLIFEATYSVQRLEFLGDAVLDVLITCHLYENHRDVDPGELTDLRSASVNNDNFALASVRRNLHPHLQHSSPYLENQIYSFVESVSGMSTTTLAPDVKGPKVSSLDWFTIFSIAIFLKKLSSLITLLRLGTR